MNLRAEIKPELWNAISKQYESELYSNAILEAIHYLSNILRERANIDGDGVALVGQALGGDQPRLRINKFQTESEKNEQKGLENILRGIYLGIRNPRSHEQNEDTQSTADAIIVFVNYILEIIGQAKEPFSLDEWVERVFDPNFVASQRYAQLLVSEVPPKKYMDVLISIYRKKNSGNEKNLRYVFKEFFDLIGDNQLGEFISVVSDELKKIQGDNSIRIILGLFPAKLWPQINEIARLRIETKLIQSIKAGTYDDDFESTNTAGILGTWGSQYIEHFTLKKEISYTLLSKLQSNMIEEHNYVAKYFLLTLPDTIDPAAEEIYKKNRRDAFIKAIATSILAPDGSEILKTNIFGFFSWPDDWRDLVIEKLKPLEKTDNEYYKKLLASMDNEFPF